MVYQLTNPYPGRKLGYVMAEIPVVTVSVDAIEFAVELLRQHWGLEYRYSMGHYNAPAGQEAAGFTLFQIRVSDGGYFILAVNPNTGDWWHADCELR